MTQPNFLRGFIYAYWGNIQEFSKRVGVAPSTVYTWIDYRPRGMFRVIPEVVKSNDEVSADMVINAVTIRETQIYEESKA